MIKILVTAPRGHMDSLIIREAVRSSDIEVAGAVGPCGREYIGRDAGELCGIGAIGVTVSDDIEKLLRIVMWLWITRRWSSQCRCLRPVSDTAGL